MCELFDCEGFCAPYVPLSDEEFSKERKRLDSLKFPDQSFPGKDKFLKRVEEQNEKYKRE